CSDANEAFGDSNADGGDTGVYGTDPATVDANGLVTTAAYNTGTVAAVTTADTDLDSDGLVGVCDLDDDGDGNPDTTDPNTGVPTTSPDSDNATGGIPVTTQILANDDYLNDGDVNNLGTTTITDAGTGTATGTISFDATTGELTYTPTLAEGGTVVTVDYTVCNDASGSAICTTETVTITVAYGDEDGDGVPDNLDQCPGFDDAADVDGDGVADGCDLDDDNDGIADIDESAGNFPDGDEDGDGIPNWMDTTDNDPGNTIGDGSATIYTDTDGNGIPDVYDFDGDGVPNHLDLDSDNDGIYDSLEAGATDNDNNGIADGIDTNNNGVPDSAGTGVTPIDTLSDGSFDFLNLDSDGDGCSDANEAFGDSNADGGDGGSYGIGEPQLAINANGTVTGVDYTTGTNLDVVTAGPDTDSDGFANSCDDDDDGDGTPDVLDPNPLTPTATDDATTADVGVPVTVSVLDNDDYLDNTDVNNLGTTTVTNLGTGTATGTVTINPATGEITYTPTGAEAGTDVTIVYEVCNDTTGTPICSQATVTISVSNLPDSDGDGVNDYVDLDDDNDGILDTDESPGLPAPSLDDDNDGIPNYLDSDQPGFVDANGDGVDDQYDFDGDGVPNHLDLDADNDGIYDVVETGGTDVNNDGQADDTDGDSTNNNGVPNSANGGTGNTPIDSGTNPTTPDFLDTDSDEDGCSDANEAYNDATADAGDGGQYGSGDPLTVSSGQVNANGTVVSAAYNTGSVSAVTTADTDIDGDGLVGICDLDNDGDGDPDTTDPDPNDPCVYNVSTQVLADVAVSWTLLDCDGDGTPNGVDTNPEDPCEDDGTVGDEDLTNAVFANADCDGDGVTNGDEIDPDGNGIDDGNGTDWNNPCDYNAADVTLTQGGP
ncbi:beta strand repeat-containing protein, partial [Mesoflavibacter sp. CH_XMU1404-2]|uniref:beta strand repeat-containing protein n=1 Tax=Mesoflavibacter sp. CH_XMU1404-2 TaxID=3107766 RepID=UPI0038B3414D